MTPPSTDTSEVGMSKFTPGPWIADDGDASSWGVFSDATSDAICYLYDIQNGSPYEIDPSKSEANANLIAAAPDMYEALTAVLDAFGDDEYVAEWSKRKDNQDGGSLGFFLNAKTINSMLAALAKADGMEVRNA